MTDRQPIVRLIKFQRRERDRQIVRKEERDRERKRDIERKEERETERETEIER